MFMSPTSSQLWSSQFDDPSNSITTNSTTLTSTPADLNTPEYLAQLLKDRRQLAAVPNMFFHVERLLDQEINNLRVNLFNLITRPKVDLPHPNGEKKIFQDKVYIPVKEYPDYNFVGRILGPRGLSAKQFEAETGCKIIVRGRGSFRDKQKEEENRGKPNYEHLNEDLHVILQCEDDETRALAKLKQAKEELNKLLTPPTDGEDHLKKKQLTELAILKGTYRDPNTFPKHFSPLPIGAPLILTQDLLTSSTTTTTTPLITTAFPSNCILPNTQGNFLQILTPLSTFDSMGNFVSNETQFVDYSNSIAFPVLTSAVPSTDPSSSSSSSSTTTADHSHSVRYQPYKTTSSRHHRS